MTYSLAVPDSGALPSSEVRRMPSRGIRAAVIGLGVGEQHALGYQQLDGCELVAVCDQDPAKLHEVGQRLGPDVRCTTDAASVFLAEDIDVVSICSYDDGHAAQVIAALRSGKHVMVEKPLCLSRPEELEILKAYEGSGLVLTSNLVLRASPRFRALKAAIDADEFGRLFYVEGDYLHAILHKITQGWRGRMSGYSVFYGGGIHLIDLLRWLVGAEVSEVAAMGGRLLAAGSQFDGADTAVALLRFDNGVIGKSTTAFGPSRPQLHAVQVYGERGTFVNGVPNASVYKGADPADGREETSAYPGIEKWALLEDFVHAVSSGGQPGVSARDVFRVMDVCLAAERSVREGRFVAVDYLM
jgi:predicted dehydrogenase